MTGPVDVLAEMQADIDALERRVLAGEFMLSRGYDKVNRLRSIHAAVAELIEADKEYDTAITALSDLNRKVAEQGWIEIEHDALRNACTVLVRAQARRTAALANVGGAK